MPRHAVTPAASYASSRKPNCEFDPPLNLGAATGVRGGSVSRSGAISGKPVNPGAGWRGRARACVTRGGEHADGAARSPGGNAVSLAARFRAGRATGEHFPINHRVRRAVQGNSVRVPDSTSAMRAPSSLTSMILFSSSMLVIEAIHLS